MVRYRCILADPPWHYDRVPGTVGSGDEKMVVNGPLDYPTLTIPQIASMPVADLADPKGCHLWLWTTSAHLGNAFTVMEGWGFEYRQVLLWHKTRNPPPFLASVAPIHQEFILFGTRGKPPRRGTLDSSVISYPSAQTLRLKHSEKPKLFHQLIERVSFGPFLELFARRSRPGWDVWGNQAPGSIEWVTLG